METWLLFKAHYCSDFKKLTSSHVGYSVISLNKSLLSYTWWLSLLLSYSHFTKCGGGTQPVWYWGHHSLSKIKRKCLEVIKFPEYFFPQPSGSYWTLFGILWKKRAHSSLYNTTDMFPHSLTLGRPFLSDRLLSSLSFSASLPPTRPIS